MKVVYNWLKEFVGVTASPEELASRLALSGTNIASVENGPHGAVLDAEVTSNRPDCLCVYGVAREVSAVFDLDLAPWPGVRSDQVSLRNCLPHGGELLDSTRLLARASCIIVSNPDVGADCAVNIALSRLPPG